LVPTFAFMFKYKQQKFASSNDTLSSSQTTLAYSRFQLLKAVSAKQPWSV